jgi:3-oxoacyl-[acyl-carrier protein] reductase
VLNARTPDGLRDAAQTIVEETDARVHSFAGDTSEDGVAERIVNDAIRVLGHIDILIGSTGSTEAGRMESIADRDWMSGLESKLMGYVRMCRAVLPHMLERGHGSIVLVVGNAGLKPSSWEVIPAAANAAAISFASSLADQFASRGVRINTVNPGPVETARWEGSIEGFAAERGLSFEDARSVLLSSLPMGRPCTADEVAPMIALLASPLANCVTGAHIPIDGGQRKALMDL